MNEDLSNIKWIKANGYDYYFPGRIVDTSTIPPDILDSKNKYSETVCVKYFGYDDT
jgi:hypothetical protein